MSNAPDIALSESGGVLFAAWLRDGQVTDLWTQRADDRLVEGTVVAGRVTRLLKAGQGAWADIGLGQSAPLASPGEAREGQLLPLQLLASVRAMRDGKLPSLTRDVALPGRFLVHRPLGEGVSFSRRLDKARRILPPALEGRPGGWLVREASGAAAGDDIAAEAGWLARQGAGLNDMPDSTKAGAVLLDGPTAWQRAILDAATPHAIRYSPALRLAVTAWVKRAVPGLVAALRHESEPALDALVDDPAPLLAPSVPLPDGGTLWIEHTRALAAVDIDAPMGARAMETNLKAARELARQIRLRNLGGLFAVDFLRMGKPAERAGVLECLRDALEPGPARHHFDPSISPTGPYLFSRERRGTPLMDVID